MKRIRLDTVDSTMKYLACHEVVACEDSFVLVTAEQQTEGRGQQGTLWESERGKNLLFSIRLDRPPLKSDRLFLISEANALALVEALDEYAEGFSIKWPNDIYIQDKKISGTLVQHTFQGAAVAHTIVGVGLNVNQMVFKSDAPNPVSLINVIGREVERERLLSAYLERFEAYLQMLSSDRCEALHQRYLHRLYRLGEWADYRDVQGSFSARIVDVEHAGTLVVALPDGTQRRYAFKEVQYE